MTKEDLARLNRKRKIVANRIRELAPLADTATALMSEVGLDLVLIALSSRTIDPDGEN